MKEAQGSVEVTSFGQMRNINSYGSYEIGSLKKSILTSRSDAIHLRLKQSKTKRIHKLQYSLDEVRDLESKLVLITGRESEERKEVDIFLEVNNFFFKTSVYAYIHLCILESVNVV